MKKTHPELGRAFVFAGLTAALALGIIGSCCYRRHTGTITITPPRQISRIEMLDAQARPHFDEARRNIPSVVDEMTGTGALCKLDEVEQLLQSRGLMLKKDSVLSA